MDDARRRALLTSYSNGTASAIEVRRALGDITFGEMFRMLCDEGLRLPKVPTEGREETLARARAWMFPRKDG